MRDLPQFSVLKHTACSSLIYLGNITILTFLLFTWQLRSCYIWSKLYPSVGTYKSWWSTVAQFDRILVRQNNIVIIEGVIQTERHNLLSFALGRENDLISLHIWTWNTTLLNFRCMFMQLTKLHCLNPIQVLWINLVKLPFHFSAIWWKPINILIWVCATPWKISNSKEHTNFECVLGRIIISY